MHTVCVSPPFSSPAHLRLPRESLEAPRGCVPLKSSAYLCLSTGNTTRECRHMLPGNDASVWGFSGKRSRSEGALIPPLFVWDYHRVSECHERLEPQCGSGPPVCYGTSQACLMGSAVRCRQEFLRICELMKLQIFDTERNRIQSQIYYNPANVCITPEINISEIDL